jgi:glycosyltransferase involved in cell wall biosynthesis
MTKILFNCSTNIQGGAAQNAANFIMNAIDETEFGNHVIEYYYILSPQVKKILDDFGYICSNYKLVKKSPSKNLSSRKLIHSIEKNYNPDLVFTMAGPAYVDFNASHIMGCSNPYVIFANMKDIFFGRTFTESIYRYAQTSYQKYYIKKADNFIFQSKASQKKFSKNFNIDNKNSFIVPNAMGLTTTEPEIKNKNLFQRDHFLIFCPFENYPHKGLHIIPRIIEEMLKKYKAFKFIVTTPSEFQINYTKKNPHLMKYISLIGKQPYKSMGNLYDTADIVFMPSILEIFSSVCIEALFFRKPLVVADREFNREILGKYAIYCDPFSIRSCYEAIESAYKIKENAEYLEAARNYICAKYGGYDCRYTNIKKILMSLTNDLR